MSEAKFYPSVLPKHILHENGRAAEVETFNAFKEDMPKGFHVFYSCYWLDKRENPVPSQDGEADFVIAHPELGFITLEVKGGVVGRDPVNQSWYRQTKAGRKPIKDPVAQARTSKHVILDWLKKTWPVGQMPYIRMRHGVILPHCSKPENIDYFGASMPLSIFAFKGDMRNLSSRVIEMMMSKEGQGGGYKGKLGSIGISSLKNLFVKEIDLQEKLNSVLDVYDERISDNTDSQKNFLEFSKYQTKALIIGGAGTGKTFLAKQKASEFSLAGLETLMVYFNSPIAKQIKQDLKDLENVTVVTFHELCMQATSPTMSRQPGQDDDQWFNEILPKCLIEALSNASAKTFDAVIVDESQDLREDWLETVILCLKDFTKGKLFIFSDDNQNLYGQSVAIEKMINVQPFALNKNVRNTEKIFDFSKAYYSGITETSYKFDGPDVDFVVCDKDAISASLLKYINRLRDVDGVPLDKIAVLSFASRKKSKVFDAIVDISVSAEHTPSQNELIFDSVWRFKGLERQIVILVDLDQAKDRTELYYVAFTRARTMLTIFGNSVDINFLKNLQ